MTFSPLIQQFQLDDAALRAKAVEQIGEMLRDGAAEPHEVTALLFRALNDTDARVVAAGALASRHSPAMLRRADVAQRIEDLKLDQKQGRTNPLLADALSRLQERIDEAATPLHSETRRRPITTPTAPDERNEIFISYSHKDYRWRDALLTALKPLEREGVIPKAWSDRDIRASENWRLSIQQALARAKVAILLISPDFLASDFIADEELNFICEAHTRGELHIGAIAVSSSNFKYSPCLEPIQMLNDPGQPLDLLSKARRNRQWADISSKIETLYHT